MSETRIIPDYYKRLEVAPNATREQIKNAYRRLVRLYHPDVNKQTQDTRIKQLNEAYAVLNNPAKRTAYDALRHKEQQAAKIADAIREEREQQKRAAAKQEPKMTWMEGAFGFVRELKKGLKDS
jgi:curved DNA-binding protein CbpA